MKNFLVLILVSFSILNVNAQTALDSADLFFNTKQYARAVEMYNKAASQNPTKSSLINLGKSYTELRMFDKALYAYSMALDIDSFNVAEKKLFLNMLKSNGKYKEARAYILANSNFNQFDLRTIDSIEQWTKSAFRYELKNLPINSNKNDFSLEPLGTDKFIFSSDRNSGEKTNATFEFNNEAYLDLYTVDKADLYKEGAKMTKFKKNSNYHDATTYYDAKNNKLYFTRNFYDEKKQKRTKEEGVSLSRLKIVILDLDSNSKIKNEVDFIHNNPAYNVSHPYIDATGRRLYFVSDMPGGFGGTDIYYSDIDLVGNWGKPVNAGRNINTSSNEMFPFVTSNNDLYFSSEGHTGFGGLDIFQSKIIKKSENAFPVNLGNVINSPYDDFALYAFNDNLDSGFICSNRPNGRGLDDIYQFNKIKVVEEKKPIECKNFTVLAKDIENGQIIANCKVTLNNITTGEKVEGMTDSYGKATFCVSNSNTYSLLAENGDYLTNSFDDLLPAVGSYTALLNKKVLNKAIEIKNIYYEFNKAYIHPDAVPNLNKLATLLNKNPEIKVELSSHTDSRGDDNYNMNLSQQRAESVVKYLINQGIDPMRMIAKGYGESQLVNNCTNGVPCPETMHVNNRRTEFKIVDINNNVTTSKADKSLASAISKTPITITAPVVTSTPAAATSSINVAEKYTVTSTSNILNSTFFTIQVGAFSRPSSSLDEQNSDLKINYLPNNDKYVATIGSFMSQSEAMAYHETIRYRFPNSFIVKFVNGSRVLLK